MILRVLLLYLFLAEIVDLLIMAATAIADLFPAGTFDDEPGFPGVIALLLIPGVSFLFGIIVRPGVARVFRVPDWVSARYRHRVAAVHPAIASRTPR